MVAYSFDLGGFLTSEQIEAATVYLRSLEEDARNRPGWRLPQGAAGNDDEEPADADDEETEPEFDAAVFFGANCADCHGADLSDGDGPALGPMSTFSKRSLFGRDEMPAFIGELKEDQNLAIIASIREIQAGG
ncbi:MAG: cytochrome c [Acidobacteria bacterium]|nr:cytochrome c [Acidobacteriota bacterium]